RVDDGLLERNQRYGAGQGAPEFDFATFIEQEGAFTIRTRLSTVVLVVHVDVAIDGSVRVIVVPGFQIHVAHLVGDARVDPRHVSVQGKADSGVFSQHCVV